jgi:hypothetical protein
MVPGNDPVIQTEHHVGNLKVIESGSRKPLEDGAPVIADVSGKTALKRREFWDGLNRLRREECLGHTQGISRNRAPLAPRMSPYLRNLSFTADYAKRIGGEEGVVCIRVIGSGAVEKQHVWKIEEPVTDLSRLLLMPERLDEWCEAAQSPLRRSSSDGFADPLARLPVDLRER